MTAEARFDPAALAHDPYGCFARMRQAGPLCWHEPTRSWYVTSYQLVADLLTDPRLSARPAPTSADLPPEVRRIEQVLDRWPLFNDPPLQTTSRTAVAPAFSRRHVLGLREPIRTIVRELLEATGEELFATGGGDVLAALAEPLAARVTCALLGLPAGYEPMLRPWSDAILAYLASDWDESAARRAMAAVTELGDLVPVVSRADGLAGLAALPAHQAVSMLTQIVTGGIDPVASAVATAATELLRRPAEAERVLTEPGRGELAAEEALRLGAPFHFVTRRAAEPLRVDGQAVAAESRVVLVVAAANRDPVVYAEPDEFRPGRAGPKHLSFGHGTHYCPGAGLARIVVTEAVTALAGWVLDTLATVAAARHAPRTGLTVWADLRVAGSMVGARGAGPAACPETAG